ncbi:MAG: hypothetical protein WD872_02940 [Pirellulaceae bacterium]
MSESPRLLPPFDSDGLLPPGDYALTLAELARSQLVIEPIAADFPNWDAAWRWSLVNNLEILARQLWRVGVTEIFVDGSFVEDKDHPNDIDGYFECDLARLASGELQRDLNLLDPYKVWTWDPASRRPYPGHAKRQLPMWHAYRVELYPHYGQPCGIRDQSGHELEFPSAFRRSRQNSKPRGIIKIVR